MRKYSTIANGDCLFAAFAMAYREKRRSMTDQLKDAAIVRRQVVDFLARHPEYFVLPPIHYEEDIQRMRQTPGVSEKDISNASNWKTPATWKNAYLRIIGTPGAWSGSLEIQALTHLYEVKIVVNNRKDMRFDVGGEEYEANGTVYLDYDGDHFSAMF